MEAAELLDDLSPFHLDFVDLGGRRSLAKQVAEVFKGDPCTLGRHFHVAVTGVTHITMQSKSGGMLHDKLSKAYPLYLSKHPRG